MDRFDDMSVFQIIARTGTISAAAGELGVAPSAVSRRLKALEDRLGVQLVQRTTRKLTLSPAGEAYLSGVSRILADVDDLEGGLQAGQGTLSGLIRMTAPLSFGLRTLPDVVDGFMRLHPGVSLDLNLTDSRMDLVADGLDLALRIGRLESSTLIAKRLCDVDFALCMSPAFFAQNPHIKAPEDLAGLPGCIYTNESQSNVLNWTTPDGTRGQVTLTPVFRANNGDILRELAVRGHGVVCSPRFILGPAIKSGQLVSLFDEMIWAQSALYAVYPPTSHMPARVRALIDYLALTMRPAT